MFYLWLAYQLLRRSDILILRKIKWTPPSIHYVNYWRESSNWIVHQAFTDGFSTKLSPSEERNNPKACWSTRNSKPNYQSHNTGKQREFGQWGEGCGFNLLVDKIQRAYADMHYRNAALSTGFNSLLKACSVVQTSLTFYEFGKRGICMVVSLHYVDMWAF